METQSDSSVMRQVQAGEIAQLAVLFERYHLPLFRYLLHLTADRPLSEDLTQEVFFRVLKYAQSFDLSQSFPTWLYQMARNACFDWRRKRRGEVPDDGVQSMRSSDPMPEELFARKQDVLFLRKALRELPEEKRELLVLSRFQGLRHDEIARILECEVGAVKVRVYRALKDLRETFCALRGEKAI